MPALLAEGAVTAPSRGQRVLRVSMYRGKRWVGSFSFWDQASLTAASAAKVHGETPPVRKTWDSAHVSGETFGFPEHGPTGYGPTFGREEVLGSDGFATIVRRCGLRYCARHGQLALCTVCDPPEKRYP